MMNSYFEEIYRNQLITPHPNFTVQLGESHDWCAPPPRIPQREYVEILQGPSADEEELLKKRYLKKDNVVPPEYCLKPRAGKDDLLLEKQLVIKGRPT